MEKDESSNVTPDSTVLRLQNDGKDLGESSRGQPTETGSSVSANSGDTCLLISQETTVHPVQRGLKTDYW